MGLLNALLALALAALGIGADLVADGTELLGLSLADSLAVLVLGKMALDLGLLLKSELLHDEDTRVVVSVMRRAIRAWHGVARTRLRITSSRRALFLVISSTSAWRRSMSFWYSCGRRRKPKADETATRAQRTTSTVRSNEARIV